jgi:hypothetical protein
MAVTTEERIRHLEADVEWLKAQVSPQRPGVVGKTHPSFLETCVGIFADDPFFEEMDQKIQQEREKERQQATQSDRS